MICYILQVRKDWYLFLAERNNEKRKKYQARDIRHILFSRQAKGIIVEDSTTGIFEGAQDYPGFLQ